MYSTYAMLYSVYAKASLASKAHCIIEAFSTESATARRYLFHASGEFGSDGCAGFKLGALAY